MLSNILMHNVSVFFTKGHNCFATHKLGSFLKKKSSDCGSHSLNLSMCSHLADLHDFIFTELLLQIFKYAT